MAEFYVLNNRGTVFVKAGWYFKEQGGLTKSWGRYWQPVEADSIEHARKLGAKLHSTPNTTEPADLEAVTHNPRVDQAKVTHDYVLDKLQALTDAGYCGSVQLLGVTLQERHNIKQQVWTFTCSMPTL